MVCHARAEACRLLVCHKGESGPLDTLAPFEELVRWWGLLGRQHIAPWRDFELDLASLLRPQISLHCRHLSA